MQVNRRRWSVLRGRGPLPYTGHIMNDVIAYPLHGNCYINLTNRCTLRCRFCPKFNRQWVVQDYPLRLHGEPGTEEVLAAVGDPARYREIVFCGLGEPTLRLETLLETAAALKQRGARIRLNTDGLANRVHGSDVTAALGGCIDALSVSLNAQDAPTYDRHCRPPSAGAYAAVCDFVRCARRHIPDITLTAIDGLDGVDITACRARAERLGVSFRRRILDQVG